MAKKTLFELENGKIEYSNDGETEVYTYQDTPFDELNDQQKQEIRESLVMKDFIEYANGVMQELQKVFAKVAEAVIPVFNRISQQIKEAEAEAEKQKKAAEAKAKKAKKSKKEKSDEQA